MNPKTRMLVDGDWIAYKACSAIAYDKETKSNKPPHEQDFEDVLMVFFLTVKGIKEDLELNSDPLYFFNGAGDNFRNEIATQKRYKGVRPPKPYWYEHLLKFLYASEDCYDKDNMEGDDAMAIYQTWAMKKGIPTIIVAVDKDLRQVEGWHYSPEIWNSPSFGPFYNDEVGWIELGKSKAKKIVGMGQKFFWSQVLTGDTVDNIPGLDKCGPVAALSILEGCNTTRECFEAVRWAYRGVSWEPEKCMKEQIDLLWMVREVDVNDKPILWDEFEL